MSKYIELEASIFRSDDGSCTMDDLNNATDAIIEALESIGLRMCSLQCLVDCGLDAAEVDEEITGKDGAPLHDDKIIVVVHD